MTEFFDHDSRTVAVTQIQAGDYISFSGIMNTASAFTVNAAVIKDWSAQIKSTLLGMRTFEGSLQSVSATSLPVTLTMMIDNMSFTVNVPADISILDKNWAVTPISNFQAGDTVRIYGAIEAANTSVIDATVVRNASR